MTPQSEKNGEGKDVLIALYPQRKGFMTKMPLPELLILTNMHMKLLFFEKIYCKIDENVV